MKDFLRKTRAVVVFIYVEFLNSFRFLYCVLTTTLLVFVLVSAFFLRVLPAVVALFALGELVFYLGGLV